MNPSLNEVVRFSWKKTKELLFPFELKRWLKILLIFWLAGQFSGTFRGGSPGPADFPSNAPSQKKSEGLASLKNSDHLAASRENKNLHVVGRVPFKEEASPSKPPESKPPIFKGPWARQGARALAPFTFLFALLAFAILIFFSWVSSRFRFIVLDFMTSRDVQIRSSFSKHKEIGNALFLFWMIFLLASAALLGAFVGGLFLMNGLSQVLTLVIFLPLLILGLFALAAAGILFADFVVPIMYQERIRPLEACKRFFELRPTAGQLAIYLLSKLGFGVLAMLLYAIVGVLLVLIGVLLGFLLTLVLAIPAGLVSGVLPFLKPVFSFMAVLLLVAAVIFFVVLFGLATLPAPVFFQAFALTYLAKLSSRYNLLGFAPSL